MEFINFLISILLGITPCIMLIGWIYYKKKRRNLPKSFDGVHFGVEYATELLKEIGCRYEEFSRDKDDEDNSVSFTYTFTYQGGHFVMKGNTASVFVKVVLPNIESFDMSDIDTVRVVCNMVNSNMSALSRVEYYITDDEKHANINAVVGFSLMNTMPEVNTYFEKMLGLAFYARNSFDDALKILREEQSKSSMADVEREYAMRRREIYLVRELEAKLDHTPRYDVKDTYTLHHFIRTIIGYDNFVPVKLTVVNDANEVTVKEKEDALNHDIMQTMVVLPEGDARKAVFRTDRATLIVTCKTLDINEPEKTILINLKNAGESDHTLYVRALIAEEGDALSRNSSYENASAKAHSTSVLLAFDKARDREKQAELEYMWKDMQDKFDAGNYKELTEEQRMLIECSNTFIRNDLYFGKKCFNDERYYEAIAHFENSFSTLMATYDTASQNQREVFHEICYMLGFCYMELQQYDRAGYYLEMVAFKSNVKYDMEYINCLVNSGDFRALDIVNNIAGKVQNVLGKYDDDSDNNIDELEKYANFLLRRRCYLLVEKNRLDEAEELLRPLLDDPDNGDFALQELAYIESLRKKTEPDEK